MEGSHLRVMCQCVGVYLSLEEQELDDVCGCVLHCQVQERLAEDVEAFVVWQTGKDPFAWGLPCIGGYLNLVLRVLDDLLLL